MLGRISSWKCLSSTGTDCSGQCFSPSWEVFKRHCRCGTWEHGLLVDLSVLGLLLVLITVEGFYNVNDCMVLQSFG